MGQLLYLEIFAKKENWQNNNNNNNKYFKKYIYILSQVIF